MENANTLKLTKKKRFSKETISKARKKVRKFLRKATKRENLFKVIIAISALALVASSVLPYIIR